MQEIIEYLSGLGYQGECFLESTLDEALENGISSASFRSLICWLTSELVGLHNLDEQIHPQSQSTEFVLELSSLLKELCCPYLVLISGSTSQRFQSKQDRLLLINYLISELMAAKMSHKLNPHKKVVIEIIESPSAIALKSITQNLNLGKPPQNITPKVFFERLLNQFSELYKKNENLWGKALYAPNKSLTYEEWKKLEKFQNELDSEYDLRREMLLTRLDVTIQSFQWSDAAKSKGNTIAECFLCKRQELEEVLRRNKATDIVELLAARNDLLHVEKTSSANVRKNTQTDLQKHIIGMVPDRGGRANEHQPPPPEMPAWQKNRNQGGQGGGNKGGSRDFNYKGQNPQQQRNSQQNYQQQGSHQNFGKYSTNNFPQNFGTGDSNYSNSYNNNNRGGFNNRVQGGWSQSGSTNRSNESYRNYGQSLGENNGAASKRGNFHGQQQNRGDGYSRGHSSYSRGGRR